MEIFLFKNTGAEPGLGSFSNANSFVLDQLLAEMKTYLKSSSNLLLESIFNMIIRHSNKKFFTFKNRPTAGTKKGVPV